MELSPQTVFERLFGDSGTQEQRAARWREKSSMHNDFGLVATR